LSGIPLESKNKVNADTLAQKIRQTGSEALFINDFDGILEHLQKHVQPGDLVVTMGAGTIWKVADEYLRWLEAIVKKTVFSMSTLVRLGGPADWRCARRPQT
jgi:hypothetical protein